MPSNTPVALTLNVRSNASGVSSTTDATWMMPALLTRAARRPRAPASATAAAQSSGDVAADHDRALARQALEVRGALAARAAGDDRHASGQAAAAHGAHRNALPPVATTVSPVT
jgi:hypothetical protein